MMGATGPLTTHCLHSQPDLDTARPLGESQDQMDRRTRKARPQGKAEEQHLWTLFPTPGRSPIGIC